MASGEIGELKDLLVKGAEQVGVILNGDKINKFFKYMDLLKEWNQKVNLTSIEGDRDIIIKHFIDSLSIYQHILRYISDKNMPKTQEEKTEARGEGPASNGEVQGTYEGMKQPVKLIDVGTGAGFPGIPLKIVCDELEVTLLDSLEKRVRFLEECIKSLKLSNINAVHGRAEDYGSNPLYREKYDISTARAVAELPVLLEYCLPFVKTGGIFIAMKGRSAEEVDISRKALDILGGEIELISEITLPFTDNIRNIIVIKKFRQTDIKYPRKAGKPSKMPLK